MSSLYPSILSALLSGVPGRGVGAIAALPCRISYACFHPERGGPRRFSCIEGRRRSGFEPSETNAEGEICHVETNSMVVTGTLNPDLQNPLPNAT